MRSSLFNYPFDVLFIRRHEPLTGHIFHHPHAARPALQRIPDGQQAALAVFPPLAIPETQRLDVLLRQKFFADGIALQPFRQAVLRTVQLHVQPRHRTIEIQKVITRRMLPAKFETGKLMTAQRPPQIPLIIRLIMTKPAGGGDRVHPDRMQIAAKNSSRDVSPHPDPLPVWAGRGKQIHALGHDGGAHLQTAPFLPRLAKRGEGRGEEKKL